MYSPKGSSSMRGKVEAVNHGGNMNILVKKVTDNSTKVNVNAFYSCMVNKYRYASLLSTDYILESSTKTDCESTGILEKAIFDYLSKDDSQPSPQQQ